MTVTTKTNITTAPDVQTDPVCGMQVDAVTAASSAQYEGSIYYFCSEHCQHQFNADPTAYVLASGPTCAIDIETTYTCPMHPEVRQQGPGSCPKCGMALEPETLTAPTTHW